jgi:glutamate-1-semialdehyde 2,1-aminomutase
MAGGLKRVSDQVQQRQRPAAVASDAHLPAHVAVGAEQQFPAHPSMAFTVATALGARVFDPAGRSYVDLSMGHGALLLGHGAIPIKQAIQTQLEAGWLHGFDADVVERVALMINAAGRSNEQVMFCTSENEAKSLVLVGAQNLTERRGIAVFDAVGRDVYAPSVRILEYGSPTALDVIRRERSTIAAVIVEPFPALRPSLDFGPWLRELQGVCRDNDVIFVLDETTSGFRVAYGGAQELFDLAPDFVIYGNVVGGGLPIGIVAGRATPMSIFGGGDSPPRAFRTSTHAGNPLSAAAAEATLHALSMHRDTIYPQLESAATVIRQSIESALERNGPQVRMYCAGSYFRLEWTAHSDTHRARFESYVRDRRIIVPSDGRCFLSTAHTVADIGKVAAVFSEGLSVNS